MSMYFFHQKGIAMIELIVYLAVTVLIATAMVTTFLSLDTVLLRNKVERQLTDSATVSLERMGQAIKTAESVNVGQSVFGTSPGTLTLTEGGTTTRFALVSSKVVLTVNGAEVGPLTSDAVTVDSLIFTHYIGSTTEMVRASLTLTAVGKGIAVTRTYYTSGVLRGSYE